MKAADDSANKTGPGVAAVAMPVAPDALPETMDSGWSALMDGYVDATEAEALFSDRSGADMLGTWQAYQTIGDALRGQQLLVPSTPAPDFLRAFQAKIQAELVTDAPNTRASKQLPVDVVRLQKPASAANDASFRWKMVAMAASLSAVMAVSWSLLGNGSPGGVEPVQPVLASLPNVSGPEMSELAAAATSAPEAANAVIVNTTQGPLIRDARLEALLAEHRQYGGMSALQMPAGFLRNATYDAPER